MPAPNKAMLILLDTSVTVDEVEHKVFMMITINSRLEYLNRLIDEPLRAIPEDSFGFVVHCLDLTELFLGPTNDNHSIFILKMDLTIFLS